MDSQPNRTTQLEAVDANDARVVSLTTFDPRSGTCSERVSVEAPAPGLTLELDTRGHEMVLPERAYRREVLEKAARRSYRPNDYVLREMAPLGRVQ